MTAPSNFKPDPYAGADQWQLRWQRFSASSVRWFHIYASWLVSISWRMFLVLATALLVGVALIHSSPPWVREVTWWSP